MQFGRIAMSPIRRIASLARGTARAHAQPSEVASTRRALAYSIIRLHENLGKPRGRGVRVNSEADRGGERVCAIGTCDARLRRGL